MANSHSLPLKKQSIADSPTWLLVGMVFIVLALPAIFLSPGADMIRVSDLPNFYTIAKMLVSGHCSQIYDPAVFTQFKMELFPGVKNVEVPVCFPPMSLLCFLPLLSMPPNVALIVWPAFLVLVNTLNVMLIKTVFQLSNRQTIWSTLIIAFSAGHWESIRVAQLSPLILLGFLAANLMSQKNKLAISGACQSIWMLKPHLLLPLLLYQLASKRYALVGWTLLFIGCFTLVALPIFGWHGFEQYFYFIGKAGMSSEQLAQAFQPTLRGQLLKLGCSPAIAAWAGIAGFLLANLIVVLLGRKWGRSPEAMQVACLTVIPLAIIFSLHLLNYDFLLLLPAVFSYRALFSKASYTWYQKLAVLVGLSIFILPIYAYIHYYYVLQSGLFNPFFIVLSIGEYFVLVKLLARNERELSFTQL